MIKRFALSLTLLLCLNAVFSQQEKEPVLLNIAGENITRSEFMAVYNKNNTRSDIIDPKTVDEYLELYINFKLKVKEAVELGMDTVSSFVNELKGYRHTLAQPYLTDKDVNDKTLKEAYGRMQTDLRASHILIRVSPQSSPADTLMAYNKALTIRKRLLSGENFAKVAAETSEDPSARDTEAQAGRPGSKGNGGDLGYFSVLDMVYPFENGAYALELNKISMPIRSDFGYHIVLLTDKRPAAGKMQVAHIFLRMPPNATLTDSTNLKNKAMEIHEKITAGMKFEDAVISYSDDKGSAAKDGVLPWFGVNRMVPEFVTVLYDLKNTGDISKPVLTTYGWHIIKMIERKAVGSYEQELPELKRRVGKDSRAMAGRDAAIASAKKDYAYKEFRKALKPIYASMDSMVFSGVWKAPVEKKMTKKLLTINGLTYTQNDLIQFIRENQTPGQAISFQTYVDNMFKRFSDEICIKVLDSKLEEKYPEFKALMTEYHDGILLFSLTDEKVWSKAIRDTTGLEQYYGRFRDKYMWGERVHAIIYTCSSDSIATVARNFIKKGIKDKKLIDTLNTNSHLNIKYEEGNFSRNEVPVIDQIEWVPGLSKNFNLNGSVVFVEVLRKLYPGIKNLDEARGIVTADYQNYLEKQWIQSLRAKYPVTINQKVLQSISSE